jgi:hypothetical protein
MQVIVGIVALVSFLAATALMSMAEAMIDRMVHEIDEHSGAAGKLGRRFLGRWKLPEIVRRHRVLLPVSQTRHKAKIYAICGIFFAITSFIMIQILLSGSLL